MLSYVFLVIILIFISYQVQSNIYQGLNLPLTHYTLNWFSGNNENENSIYQLTVFKSLSNDYMLILEPQNIHLFIEDAKTVIYHPVRSIKNLYYFCPESYELAYAIADIPKIMCHRPLDYTKKFVYTEKIYVKMFNEMQNPLDVIQNFFQTIQKIEGVNSLLSL